MDNLLQRLIDAQQVLANAKATELALRKEMLEEFPGEIGSSLVMFPDIGMEMKITRGTSISIDKKVLDEITKDLSGLEAACITYKPSIIKKVYDQLKPGSNLSRAIIVKPSLPSIKIVPMKESE